jgi:hypothetical protein
MIRIRHVRRTISYIFLAKAVVGGAFAVLTLCGVTLPYLGLDFTAGRELLAGGAGGVLGVIAALKA